MNKADKQSQKPLPQLEILTWGEFLLCRNELDVKGSVMGDLDDWINMRLGEQFDYDRSNIAFVPYNVEKWNDPYNDDNQAMVIGIIHFTQNI